MSYFYSYDSRSEIIAKLPSQPTDGDYVISDIDFDLDTRIVIIGNIDADKNLGYPTIKAKPAEVLIGIINDLKSENNILGESVAMLTLQNMQLNTTIDTLGAAQAQTQLDIIALKGGAA